MGYNQMDPPRVILPCVGPFGLIWYLALYFSEINLTYIYYLIFEMKFIVKCTNPKWIIWWVLINVYIQVTITPTRYRIFTWLILIMQWWIPIRSCRIFRLLGYAPRSEMMWAHFMKFLMDILPKCFQRVGPCPFPPGSGECQHYSALSLWPPWHVLTNPQQESSTFSSWKHTVTLSWQYPLPSDHGYVCIFMYKKLLFLLPVGLQHSPHRQPSVQPGSGYQWYHLFVPVSSWWNHVSDLLCLLSKRHCVSNCMGSKTHEPRLTSLAPVDANSYPFCFPRSSPLSISILNALF